MTQPTISTNRWRTVDVVVAAVIAVAFGVVFWGWNQLWNGFENTFKAFPPGNALFYGVWFLPAVIGPLVIRRPGAGVFTEAVAATVSALLGAQWGLATVLYGLIQGAFGEAAFAATAYRSFRLPVALVGGALAGAGGALLDLVLYYGDWSTGWQVAHVCLSALSGLVIAGLGGWALTQALGQTGALDRFPSGRDRVTV